MTQAEYIRRIERAFRACEWGYSNPYREIQQQRLEQANAEHREQVAEAKSIPTCEF